jgi:hypothetical protein
LDEAETFGRVTDTVRAMTLDAIDPGNPTALGKMTAHFELSELRLMTISTERESHVGVRFAAEISRVGFCFIGLRGIAPVTAGAIDAGFTVRSGAMKGDYFSRPPVRPGVAFDALIISPRISDR